MKPVRHLSCVAAIVCAGLSATAMEPPQGAQADRLANAQDTVRRFYRCLLGESTPGCRTLLVDAMVPDFERNASVPTWDWLKRHSTLLHIPDVDEPGDVSRLRMRVDVSAHDLAELDEPTIVVPDIRSFNRCGVMREVRIPLERRRGTNEYGVFGAAVTVNGANVYRESHPPPGYWQRVLCPADPESEPAPISAK